MKYQRILFLLAHIVLVIAEHQEEHHEPASYKFSYGVHDPHTNDIKSQWEERDGHYVKGAYTLKEADGTYRIVEYIAGPHIGFRAVVKRIGHAHHPAHYGHGHESAHHGGESYVHTLQH